MSDVIDAEVTSLVVSGSGALSIRRAPETVLAEAHKAAAALKRVIDAKPKKVMFNGEQYLEFEDWQTTGRFYDITPSIVEDRYVEYGGARGFEAVAVAIRGDGVEISRAAAMCLDDEENWGSRSKYEWHYVRKSDGATCKEDPGREEIIWEAGGAGKGNRPRKVRVCVGEEKVPLFQLRSMAQTRAQAKVLRNVLSFVPVLAGYRPTPAEELAVTYEPNDGRQDYESQEGAQGEEPKPAARRGRPRKEEPKQEPATAEEVKPVTNQADIDEWKRIVQLAVQHGIDTTPRGASDAVHAWLTRRFKVKDFTQLEQEQRERVLAWIKYGNEDGPQSQPETPPEEKPLPVTQTASTQAVAQRNDPEIQRKVASLEKWAHNGGKGGKDEAGVVLRRKCVEVFKMGLEKVLAEIPNSYHVLIEWAAEPDLATADRQIIESAKEVLDAAK